MKDSLPRHSLRFRLLAGTMVWIALSIAAAGWGLGRLFQQHVLTQYQAELEVHLDQLTALLTVDRKNQPILQSALSDPRFNRPYSGLYWQIDALASESGPPVDSNAARSRSLWDFVLAAPPDVQADGEIHRHRIDGPAGKPLILIERTVRLDDLAGTPGRFRLLVAGDQAVVDAAIGGFNGVLWLALGGLGCGLVLAALMQVLIGLAPLRELQAALERLRAGRSAQLDGRFPEEIMPLVTGFNSVLAQNAEVVERARTQAGNLAHGLKTPLAVLANAAGGSDSELARLVREQVAVARQQVDYQLARARVAALRQPGQRTPVRPLVDSLLRTMQRLHAERHLDLALGEMDETLAFNGDAQDLQEMLGNLLDNACKWAAGRVAIRAFHDQDRLRVIVDDDGRGLDASGRAAVLGRGVRADERVSGSGLGLSIVEDLVQHYGGKLALETSPWGGLRVALSLPGFPS